MEKIEFEYEGAIYEGVSLMPIGIDCYYDGNQSFARLVYFENALAVVSFEKQFYEMPYEYFEYYHKVQVLSCHCVMKDCDDFLKTNPPVKESFVGEWDFENPDKSRL